MSGAKPPPETSEGTVGTGKAVASLVLGIMSIPFSVFILGGALGLIAVVLAAAHLRRSRLLRGIATSGAILGCVGLLATTSMGWFWWRAVRNVRGTTLQANAKATGPFSAWEGVGAPDFTVTTLNHGTLRLTDLRGKRVVLNFWATWCPPCRREIPHFVRLSQEVPAEELVILGLSDEEPHRLVPFVRQQGIRYMVASIKNLDLPSPYRDVQSIPTTFFVDRNGVIQTVLEGYRDYESLRGAAVAQDFVGTVREAPSRVDRTELR